MHHRLDGQRQVRELIEVRRRIDGVVDIPAQQEHAKVSKGGQDAECTRDGIDAAEVYEGKCHEEPIGQGPHPRPQALRSNLFDQAGCAACAQRQTEDELNQGLD